MLSDRRFQVFISSTYIDLIEERQAAMRAVLEMGHFPAGMEWFAAADEDAWTLISRIISESDFYLLIVGGRYGSTDTTGISFTEREYDHAVALGKRVIPILHKDPSVLPRNRTEVDDEAWERLTAFVEKVRQRHTCSFWETASELRARAFSGLFHAIQHTSEGGWVRGSSLPPINATTAEQLQPCSRPSSVSLQEALIENINALDKLYGSNDPIGGLPTGLDDLDRLTGGLQAGEVMTIAARPSMGCTTLALSIGTSVALTGLPILVISPVHRAAEVSKRLLTLTSGISAHHLGTGRISDEDWPKLTSALQILNDACIDIQDGSGFTPEDVEATCSTAKEKFGALPLVIIDAIDLFTDEFKSRKSAPFFRALARKFKASIILTGYVKREVEARPNKRPALTDLVFDNLSTISDKVIFLYDDNVYNWKSPDKGTVELILAANTGGPIGVIRVANFGGGRAFASIPKTDQPYFSPDEL